MKIGPVAACIVGLGVVALLIWAIARGRKGYQTVQTLMARLDAHAEATAAAQATNNVRVNVGALQSYYDDPGDESLEYAEIEQARRVLQRAQERGFLVEGGAQPQRRQLHAERERRGLTP